MCKSTLLGYREFVAAFRLIHEQDVLHPAPIQETRDLGWMLYDLDFTDRSLPTPRFFRAQMQNGVVRVPDWKSKEVLG